MDEPLRNGLWSLLQVHAWGHVTNPYHSHALVDEANREIKTLCNCLWLHFFKRPLDTRSDNWSKELAGLRTYFFGCQWYEVYDFVEFVANNYRKYKFRETFLCSCNALLEREVSAYDS